MARKTLNYDRPGLSGFQKESFETALAKIDANFDDLYDRGPSCPRIAFAGDSITAIAPYSTATQLANHPYGISSWLMPMLGQRARTDFSLNFGVSGDTSAMLLARIGAVGASAADIACVLIGTNDVNGAVSAATLTNYKSNMMAIVAALLGAGKIVVLVPPLPRDLTSNPNNRLVLHAMRQWVLSLQWAGMRNLYVADAGAEYGDSQSAVYAPKVGVSYDTLHPKSRGGYEVAKGLYKVFDRLLPPIAQSLISAVDVYDAVYNPGGNLLTNGILAGTGGTVGAQQGATTTGTVVPDNWILFFNAPYSGGSALSGLTIVGSKNTLPDGRPEQVFTVSGGYTGDVDSMFGMYQNIATPANLQVGDVVELTGELLLDASAAELPLVSPRLSASFTLPVAGGFRLSDMYWINDGYSPKEGYSLLLRSPRYKITEVPSAVGVSIAMMPRQGANTFANPGVFRFRSIALRKVIS